MAISSSHNDSQILKALFDWYREKPRYKDINIDNIFFSLCKSFDDEKIFVLNVFPDYDAVSQVITRKRVGNRVFVFPTAGQLMAVYDGQKAYDLEVAYEFGLITDEMLDSLEGSNTKFMAIYKVGDLDLDGNVTVSDIVALRKYIMGQLDDIPFDGIYAPDYDIDQDGKLSVSDVVKLRSIIMDQVK